jgi:N-acetylglucosaminyl-diphospho-decaprenol L-rhamnosyltransferase
MNNQDITIIITSFHSGEKIFNCINSIDKNIKIIVVENSNDQLLKEEILSRYNNVDCVLSKENLGYGAGNNLGLSKVETNYALIVNPDVTLKNDAIKQFFLRINKVENFGIIAPVSKDEKYNNFNIDFDKDIKEVENVKGFAMFLNMKNLKKINFFDENFFLYFEEIDLCKRVKNTNGKIYLDRNIKIIHQGASSVQDDKKFELEKNRNWHWMWSTFYYNKKHKGFFLALINILPKFFSASIKTLIYSLLFNKNKRDIYYCRLSGIVNSIIGNKSWYRPSLD